jgi:hypothetical protein
VPIVGVLLGVDVGRGGVLVVFGAVLRNEE